jgi:hypothetical protein
MISSDGMSNKFRLTALTHRSSLRDGARADTRRVIAAGSRRRTATTGAGSWSVKARFGVARSGRSSSNVRRMYPPEDDYPEAIEAVIKAVITGGRGAGARELAPFAYGPREVPKRRGPQPQQRCRIWIRDGFRCQYCGAKAIPNSLLVVLSSIYPSDFPYNRNYKTGLIHPAYEARAACATTSFPAQGAGHGWKTRTSRQLATPATGERAISRWSNSGGVNQRSSEMTGTD